MSKLYWKIQFAKRHKIVCPFDDKSRFVLEYKVIDGTQYVLKQYHLYKKLTYFQDALFLDLRPTLIKNLFAPNPLYEALLK
jgi:hypothetical protein